MEIGSYKQIFFVLVKPGYEDSIPIIVDDNVIDDNIIGTINETTYFFIDLNDNMPDNFINNQSNCPIIGEHDEMVFISGNSPVVDSNYNIYGIKNILIYDGTFSDSMNAADGDTLYLYM